MVLGHGDDAGSDEKEDWEGGSSQSLTLRLIDTELATAGSVNMIRHTKAVFNETESDGGLKYLL